MADPGNRYEARARLAKAERLADLLDRLGVHWQAALALDGEARRTLAQQAGTHPPSEATWRLACELLADRTAGPVPVGQPW